MLRMPNMYAYFDVYDSVCMWCIRHVDRIYVDVLCTYCKDAEEDANTAKKESQIRMYLYMCIHMHIENLQIQ